MFDDPYACMTCGRRTNGKDFCSEDCALDYDEPDESFDESYEDMMEN